MKEEYKIQLIGMITSLQTIREKEMEK
jgi:hypothetical protein